MFEGFAQFAAHSRDLLLGGKDDGVGVERGFLVRDASKRFVEFLVPTTAQD